jgi:3-deoxy-manno-octulosonate cytidylyltransferase (CMP-KDO synthetase)
MIIIPARLQSTRLPKKVLSDIGGVPMVIATALRASAVDDLVVATDSQEVSDIVDSFGFKSVMTNINHKSGTDRVNEVADILGLDDNEIVINLQADEPFIESEILISIRNTIENLKRDFVMVSCYKDILKEDTISPNLVKVVLDCNGDAIYFSRSQIPYDRNGDYEGYFGHLGIYGFRRASLREFCNLEVSSIEQIESLEQLRAIYHSKKIAMINVESESFGIDTQEDLEMALKLRKLI